MSLRTQSHPVLNLHGALTPALRTSSHVLLQRHCLPRAPPCAASVLTLTEPETAVSATAETSQGADELLDPTTLPESAALKTNQQCQEQLLMRDEEAAGALRVQQVPDDDAYFKLHHSVDFWGSGPLDTSSLAAEVLQHLSSGNPQALAYWSYHVARHGFFAGQMVTSWVAHFFFSKASQPDTNGGLPGTPELVESLIPVRASDIDASKLLAEALATFSQDWEAIQAGKYKLPWDMTTPSHPQYNPLNVLDRSASFLEEAVATLDRGRVQQPDNVWLKSPLYPAYFGNSHHYQTDGWFSTRSAEVYEFSTEAVFQGRQDAMQRTALLPSAAYLAGRDPSQMQLLEVAAGTGRFHTFIKDNWPDLQTTVTDLSPFYLQKARSNMQLWKQLRAADRQLGGVDGTGTSFVQCAAESLPMEAGSQDVVMCVYLFHELPPEARQAAVAEMFRVLKPGGLAVLSDSVQLGDRPSWYANLGNFGNFNEPHYATFMTCDMGDLFEEAGFECDTKYLSLASKTLSFIKPATTATSDTDLTWAPPAEVDPNLQ